jgi:hypothetical protein
MMLLVVLVVGAGIGARHVWRALTLRNLDQEVRVARARMKRALAELRKGRRP